MAKIDFPDLDVNEFDTNRDALHAYSKIPGNWIKAVDRYCRMVFESCE